MEETISGAGRRLMAYVELKTVSVMRMVVRKFFKSEKKVADPSMENEVPAKVFSMVPNQCKLTGSDSNIG